MKDDLIFGYVKRQYSELEYYELTLQHSLCYASQYRVFYILLYMEIIIRKIVILFFLHFFIIIDQGLASQDFVIYSILSLSNVDQYYQEK